MSGASEELTIEQARAMLHTSQEYLMKLLEEGTIASIKVEGQTRIQLEDLLENKKERDARRRQALEEIIRLSEEAGLYEKELKEAGLYDEERQE